MRRNVLIGGAFGGVAIAVLFGTALLVGQREVTPEVTKTAASGAAVTPAVIFATELTDIDGRKRTLGEWSGKLLVINFWATWCAPCLEEIPDLVAAQSKYAAKGLQVIGIAADSPSKVRNFSEKLKINYPVLVDESGAIALSKRMGNRLGLLPFSLVLSPAGDIVMTRLGVFTPAELDRLVSQQAP